MANTDEALGAEIGTILRNKGIETPMFGSNYLDNFSKIEALAPLVESILTILGMDLKDDSLRDTPKRVSKMFIEELFYGLDYSNFPACTAVDNKMHYDEMLLEGGITVNSQCEHHLVPFKGHAYVAYLPANKVLGLSKFNRIVDFFSRRPQVQERLTVQIGTSIQHIVETPNVAVVLECSHFCVQCRGVKDSDSWTATSMLGGIFKEQAVRVELFSLINGRRGRH